MTDIPLGTLVVGAEDPNTIIASEQGTLYWDRYSGGLYANNDGSTGWTLFSGSEEMTSIYSFLDMINSRIDRLAQGAIDASKCEYCGMRYARCGCGYSDTDKRGVVSISRAAGTFGKQVNIELR